MLVVSHASAPQAARVVLCHEAVGETAECHQPHGCNEKAQPRGPFPCLPPREHQVRNLRPARHECSTSFDSDGKKDKATQSL